MENNKERIKDTEGNSSPVRTGHSSIFPLGKSVRSRRTNGLEVNLITEDEQPSTLVIAFDGLDINLIEKFDLQNIKQEEFGKIDNQTHVSSVKTTELFTSFITGKTHQEHGVKGLKHKDLPAKLISDSLASTVPGFYTLREIFRDILKTKPSYPDKESLEIPTVFDEIDNSKALYVPGYNPSPYWKRIGTGTKLRREGVEDRSLGYYWDNHEHLRRRKELFREVNKYYDFCMVHIFRPDMHQHLYGDPSLDTYDEEKLRELYLEIDELARQIKEFFSDDFERIVFMSDHGLPTQNEHNKNAFYSSNKKLFRDITPRITDFYNKFLGDGLDRRPIKTKNGSFAGEKERKVYNHLKQVGEVS